MNKDDKKRKKRKEAAKKRKERARIKSNSFFLITGDFPYDMRGEIAKTAARYKFDNKDWKAIKDDVLKMSMHIDAMMRGSFNQHAFEKYFPRFGILWCWNQYEGKCEIRPYETKRIILGGDEYFLMPDIVKVPLFGGRKVIFTRHSFERLVQRYGREVLDIPPSTRALIYPSVMWDLSRADFETTHIKGEPYLHCFGVYSDKINAHFGRGHFPITFEGEYAIAKTFLYDDWLGSTVTN